MIAKCGVPFGFSTRAIQSVGNFTRTHSVLASSGQQPDQHLRILFCGSDDFSAFSLKALSRYALFSESNIESIDVVTRKDKRAGRGLKHIRSPFIKSVAEELQLPLHQIDTFTGWNPPTYNQDRHPSTPINLIIAVSFGLLIPPRILQGAAYGGLNIHPSLLPQLKGAAPVQWSILNGLSTTGVSLQTLHPSKFDEGVVLDSVPVSIQKPHTCTFDQLRDQLGPVGADLLIKCLRDKRYLSQQPLVKGSESEGTSYAPKIKKQHAAIDHRVHGSQQILRMQRVFKTLWFYAQELDGQIVRVLTDSIVGNDVVLQKHADTFPEFLRPFVASIPIGVPYGMTRAGKQPNQARNNPLFLNTIDGVVAIERLTVGGTPWGAGFASSAKGRLWKHYLQLKSPSGEFWDVYKFYAPIHCETDGLPTIVPVAV